MKSGPIELRGSGVHLEVWTCRSDMPAKGHDRSVVQPGFLGVADGATPLESDWPANVGEFARVALTSLARFSADAKTGIRDVWQRAIAATSEKFELTGPRLSSGIAMARLVDGDLEFALIGDCEIVVELVSGEILRLFDGRLRTLDAIAAGKPDSEQEYQQLLATRASMNSAGGYWIFAGDTDAADHTVNERLPASEVAAFLLYTDGFYRLVEPYGVAGSAEDLLTMVRERGLAAMVSLLRERESDSSTRRSGFVLSAPDDATAVFAVVRDSRLNRG
jgi:hypothetical protein